MINIDTHTEPGKWQRATLAARGGLPSDHGAMWRLWPLTALALGGVGRNLPAARCRTGALPAKTINRNLCLARARESTAARNTGDVPKPWEF